MDTKSRNDLVALLEKLYQKHQRISRELTRPEVINNREKLKTYSREIAYLKPLHDKYQRYRSIRQQLEDARELQTIADDVEMRELAGEETRKLEQDLADLKERIKESIVTDVDREARNVFLEIRAGAGGNEASLFATDLVRMYSRLSELKGWSADVIDTAHSSIGGIKEINLHIRGRNINKYLQFESGVHRVQRVPETESSGRIHTSTVTVAVIPEVEDVEVSLDPKDLRVDRFSASGPGGQHVNKSQTAIRITHLPSGLVVSCQDEKSQHKNKAKALKVLKSRLFEMEQRRQQESISSNRKSQVGSGERSEKIRTYNYPQNRVTDHRISGQNFNLEQVLDGNLEPVFDRLLKRNVELKINQKIQSLLN